MSQAIRDAVKVALDAHATAEGLEITYRRGSNTQASIPASIGSSDYEAEQLDGRVLTNQTADFIVAVSAIDWSNFDGADEPAEGDQVDATLDGVTRTYDLRPEPGVEAWRFSTEHRTHYRLHTKLVAEA